MAINTSTFVANTYAASYSASSTSYTKTTKESSVEDVKKDEKLKSSEGLGKTIGEPKLSKEAQKYYEKLKKKFGNYDFILVSEDQKANAQANVGRYTNSAKTVVLINEEKIERMATDESYRKQYEGIISGASKQLDQMQASMGKAGANVKSYGMQVNDDGTTSFFAVLKKSSSDQKARIEKTAEKKKAEKKAAEKKAEQKRDEAKLEKTKQSRSSKSEKIDSSEDDETVTFSANSLEELMQKIGDYTFAERSDNIQTDAEKMFGQHVDFKG